MWKHETWSDSDGKTVDLVRAESDGTVIVDGGRRDVHEGDAFVHSGSDTVGVYSVNEDDLRKSGFSPDDEPANNDDHGDDDHDNNDSDGENEKEPKRRVPARKRS